MSKINVLDSAVFNRIAAGEVVENPRSIVKELVENSIDAGADSVTVEIRNGGIDFICVTDNGHGIDPSDMPIAFLPHATSKIHSLKDLETISTLGFRGEALPSIASVSDVEMLSRTPDAEFGYKIVLKNGHIQEEGEYGTAFGTKITVKNLFANIPARAKFLRKPQTEESSITEFIIKIILANPSIKIKYIADGEIIYQSDGNGTDSAIFNIYGADFSNNLCPIECIMPDISISGYIGKPNFTKHNRTYQTLIVNGRYIANQDISYCIQQAYQNYLMKRQFPVYILRIDVPADMVDVNVHPNKLEVRFAGEKRLKSVIYNSVKNKIDELAIMPTAFSSDFASTPIYFKNPDMAATSVEAISEEKKVDLPLRKLPDFKTDNPIMREENIFRTKLNLNNFSQIKLSEEKDNSESKTENISFFGKEENAKYVGKLFNTYLLLESGDNFFLVDQHAAHEKLLYDKLLSQIDSMQVAVQDLLIPYIFDLSPTDKSVLMENLAEINACGFKIDPLSGNTFSLYALPACCVDINPQKFISLFLSEMGNHTPSSYIKENLMQAACKSAVKGETDLSQFEIDSLLQQMKASDSAKFCPHGRPTIIKFTLNDLEKLFKRI